MRNQIISLLLTFSLSGLPASLPAFAAETAPSTAATALEGMANVVQTGTNVLGQISANQQMLQAQMNNFAALQQQSQMLPATEQQCQMLQAQIAGNSSATLLQQYGSQCAFNNVKKALSTAFADAQRCMMNSAKDVAKYKKATIAPGAIATTEPTCSNYGSLIDSIKKNIDQMQENTTRVTCLRNLQSKIDEIAQSAKQPFAQITEAANKVWQTRTKIIENYQNAHDKIDKDLNGENGFRAQLGELKKLNANLKAAIGAGAGKDGQGGFASKIKNLERYRISAANTWYYQFMGDVESCFAGDSTQRCFHTGAPASPLNCARAYVTQRGGPNAKRDGASLEFALTRVGGVIQATDQVGKIDVKNPASFLEYTRNRFQTKLDAISREIGSVKFLSRSFDKTALMNGLQQKYQDCYASAEKKFHASLGSEAGGYKTALNQVTDAEENINFEIQSLMDGAQDQMNAFKTSFTQVFDRELPQFSADCQSPDMRENLQCLRQLSATLDSGINGTAVRLNPSDAQSPIVRAQPTVLSLQSVVQGQDGTPSMSTRQTSCVGFDECINVLGRHQTYLGQQKDAQTEQRQQFVDQHNTTVNTMMTGVSAMFSEMGKLIASSAGSINESLGALGVTGSLGTKQVEGAALVKNEETGLYDSPTDMKAALAGAGTYTELDDPTELMDGLKERIGSLEEKSREAFAMKGMCTISADAFKKYAEKLKCDEKTVCNSLPSVISGLEDPFLRSQVVPDKEDRGLIRKDYQDCLTSARNEARAEARENRRDEILIGSREEKSSRSDLESLRLRREEAKVEDQNSVQSCASQAVSMLEAIAENGRKSMKSKVTAIVEELRDIANACPADPKAAVAACKRAKAALEAATPPSDEAESPVTATDTATTTTISNPMIPGSSSAR